jgi:hypothetical protein
MAMMEAGKNIVITYFWILSNYILFSQKKKREGTRCHLEIGEKKAFKIFFLLTFSPFHLHKTLPKPIPTQPYPAKKRAPCPANGRPPYPAEIR